MNEAEVVREAEGKAEDEADHIPRSQVIAFCQPKNFA
jgi:hypothetical protein